MSAQVEFRYRPHKKVRPCQPQHQTRCLECMDTLIQLSRLIKKRNLLAGEVTALIHRPAELGHIGEYIASEVFHITLEEWAARKSIDGHFSDGPLNGRSVNIKWYALRQGLLRHYACYTPGLLSRSNRTKVRPNKLPR